MKTDWLNMAAIVLSPVFAVLISIWIQDRKEIRNRRFSIFNLLVTTRHRIATEDQVRAFNAIDTVFHDCDDVRRQWKEYFDLLNRPEQESQWKVKYLELLSAMAASIGYKDAIKHEDLDRIYGPRGLYSEAERQAELSNELLRVLKASGGISLSLKPASPGSKRDD